MNRSLAQNVAEKLMPALEQSQGFQGVYARGQQSGYLVAVPTEPDWLREDDTKSVIEEWMEVKFIVSPASWQRLGLGMPEQSDRFTVTLADGISRVYALLAKKGLRPYDMAPGATSYGLRMKWVQA